MTKARIVILPLLAAAAWSTAAGQAVVSTHSGVVYFFEGAVSVGDQRLEQKFGRFPEIGEGRELRTERGRAEVLLTPGVFLRVAENSAIRMVSNKLADTQVELLSGSAIVEASEARPDNSVTLAFRTWQVRIPEQGVYRIDCDPPRVQAYKGRAEVAVRTGKDVVAVKEGEVLPLADVLVPERALSAGTDPFKNWAMSRSQTIASDNTTAAGIIDDPTKVDDTGLAVGAYSYFPPAPISSLGLSSPYGLSFWSPYQSTLGSIYFSPYMYGALYSTWPGALRYYPRSIATPSVTHSRPYTPIYRGTITSPGALTPGRTPSPIVLPPVRTLPRAPAAAPRGSVGAAHGVGRR
jgi:hypothetical protein